MRLPKLFIIILFISIFSCYDDNTDIELTITNSEWSAIIAEGGFGEVHLNILLILLQ